MVKNYLKFVLFLSVTFFLLFVGCSDAVEKKDPENIKSHLPPEPIKISQVSDEKPTIINEEDTPEENYDEEDSMSDDGKTIDAEELVANIEQIDIEVARIKKTLNESVFIEGFVVAQLAGDHTSETAEYEIREQLTVRQHGPAILITTETRFKNKGPFSMRIFQTGKRAVKSTIESGGFSSEWPVYTEAEVRKLGEEIHLLETEKRELEKLLEEVTNDRNLEELIAQTSVIKKEGNGIKILLGENIQIDMVKIPKGKAEVISHGFGQKAEIIENNKSFYMATTETTNRQWYGVIGRFLKKKASTKDLDHPVSSLSYSDICKFCNYLSLAEGLTPVYSFEGEVIPFKMIRVEENKWDIAVNLQADGFRLPTREEFLFSTQGNSNAKYFWGEDAGKRDQYVADEVGSVARKLPNNFGLYDMAGNLKGEWVEYQKVDCANHYRHIIQPYHIENYYMSGPGIGTHDDYYNTGFRIVKPVLNE